ncbi:homing endonuclease [Serratia phage 4S]|nr:homing endonuclease [Serratia phage 4S]
MKHVLYKTTNIKNGKIYIGIHSTNDLDDGYLGSGNAIRNAISKYGKEAFKKEILCECPTREDAFKLESLIVNDEFIKDPMNYNMRPGGIGQTDISNHYKTVSSGMTDYWESLTDIQKSKIKTNMSNAHKIRWASVDKDAFSKTMKTAYSSEESREKLSLVSKNNYEKDPTLKERISKSMRKSKCWEYYDVLYPIWIQHNKPGSKKFRNIVVKLGYPDCSYQAMVDSHFKRQ